VDRAGLIREQRILFQTFPPLFDPSQRVVVAIVIPENRRRLQVSVGLRRLDFRKAIPCRAGLVEVFAIRLNFTNGGQRLTIARTGLAEFFFDGNSGIRKFRIDRAQRPVHSGRPRADDSIGGKAGFDGEK